MTKEPDTKKKPDTAHPRSIRFLLILPESLRRGLYSLG